MDKTEVDYTTYRSELKNYEYQIIKNSNTNTNLDIDKKIKQCLENLSNENNNKNEFVQKTKSKKNKNKKNINNTDDINNTDNMNLNMDNKKLYNENLCFSNNILDLLSVGNSPPIYSYIPNLSFLNIDHVQNTPVQTPRINPSIIKTVEHFNNIDNETKHNKIIDHNDEININPDLEDTFDEYYKKSDNRDIAMHWKQELRNRKNVVKKIKTRKVGRSKTIRCLDYE